MIGISAKSVSKKVLIGILLGGHLTACSHQSINVKSLFSSNNCAIKQQQLTVLDSQQALDTLLAGIPRRFSETAPPTVDADFQQQNLILLALGQKPSLGYAIQLKQHDARIKDDTLYLPVDILEPSQNSFQAQVITSPCAVFSIPKTDFKRVKLAGQSD